MPSIFKSQYPLMAVAMNQVSDAKFAVACAKAGIYPCISLFNYYDLSFKLKYAELVDGLKLFKDNVGNSEVMLSMLITDLANPILLELLTAAGIKNIEVIMPWTHPPKEQSIAWLKNAKKKFNVFLRVLEYKNGNPQRIGVLYPYVKGLMLKGNAGAGATGSQTLEELYTTIRADFPKLPLIVSGGISTREQVKHFLDLGAETVAIGTLFAVSEECKIAQEAKQLLVDNNFDKVQETTYDNKNALVVKPLFTEDPNHTTSLKLGISRPDLGGHIYAGEGINNITAIRPLKDIVADLV